MSNPIIVVSSNDIDELFKFFHSIEQIEQVFGFQYAWNNGSFDLDDEPEDAMTDPDKVLYNGVVHDYPLTLSFVYDYDARFSDETFTKIKIKKSTKAEQRFIDVDRMYKSRMKTI